MISWSVVELILFEWMENSQTTAVVASQISSSVNQQTKHNPVTFQLTAD